MTTVATQLPLHLNPSEFYHLENFYFSDAETSKVLEHFYTADDMAFLYLWGEKAVGKTHLLLAIAEAYRDRDKQVVYLPLSELVATTEPAILQNLEQLDLLCIDELEVLAGLMDWQEALFHCFNRLQQTGCKLLVASRQNPKMLTLELADLASRLATGLIYHLDTLDDDEKGVVLIQQAYARGLEINNDVAQYLLRHYSRDMKRLTKLVATLDMASMAEKRRLTIPFVKQIIKR